MPYAPAGDVEIYYEELGDRSGPALLLIAGLGAQLISWHDEFCYGLADRGFRVLRFDNRDSGLSTILGPDASYTLSHMAADAVAVLDAAEVDAAHVVGHSLGGMIAQAIAIEHPTRVLTLTSISSTTGNPEVGRATVEALQAMSLPIATTIDEAVERDVAARRVWASPSWFDEDEARAYFRRVHERSFTPGAALRQIHAVLTADDREPLLAQLDVPTLVIHGALDPLVSLDGGRRTAEVIPGAELLVIDDMAHDLPVQVWQQVISAITALAAGVAG
ncbi:MAG TPA: alpha/beta hydrolase [Acidimicrobiales bacterium]